MGHHVISEVVADSLASLGWSTEVLDCMSLLGRVGAQVGDWVFRRLTAIPTLYDGVHFAHFRPGSRLAVAADRAATSRLVPALRRHLALQPTDLLFSAFATGASAIAQLTGGDSLPRGRNGGRPAAVALCVDVAPHSLWVRHGLDLFIVTSPAAAAGVRRYVPRARIAIVAPLVRPSFAEAPTRQMARSMLGVPQDTRCVLVMGGGWGLGPLAETAEALAREGVFVLGVAGRNRKLADQLKELATRNPEILPFGFSDEIPTLMAAADLVVTTPGANTCGEARMMARPLMLLDVVAGHGRENILHELEMGDADVCDPSPDVLVECVLAALERVEGPEPQPTPSGPWTESLGKVLAEAGITPGVSILPA
jgi:hypothetical protein